MIVIFDLDDTLVDRSGAMRRWAELLVRREGLPPQATEEILYADRLSDSSNEFLARVRSISGVGLGIEDLKAWYANTYLECYESEREVAQALVLLREASWKVGVATNGSMSRSAKKLIRAGIYTMVDAVCVGEEIGVRKPDAGAFREVARRAGSNLEGWMVGDAPLEDIWGGREVGLRTAWLARGRGWTESAYSPDLQSESLREIAEYIVSSDYL